MNHMIKSLKKRGMCRREHEDDPMQSHGGRHRREHEEHSMHSRENSCSDQQVPQYSSPERNTRLKYSTQSLDHATSDDHDIQKVAMRGINNIDTNCCDVTGTNYLPPSLTKGSPSRKAGGRIWTLRRRKRIIEYSSPSCDKTVSSLPTTESPSSVQELRTPNSVQQSTTNLPSNPNDCSRSTVESDHMSSRTYFVPEEMDPLVIMSCEQDVGQLLTIEQCNKITAAVAALDKSGSDLFAKGDYNAAFLRFERALTLKRRSLVEHSAAWEQHEQQNNNPHWMKQHNSDSLQSDEKSSTNDEINTLGSLSILRSHPTYIATKHLSKQSISSSDGDDYKKNLIASVATSINNLTFLKQQNGQTSSEETLASYMQSLQMKLQVLGPTHLSVGKTLNNIGSVFYVQRQYPASLQAYLDAHCIMEAALGTNHLDVATVASNIGDAYRCLGNSDLALKFYRIALDIRWGLLPHNHPKIARLMEQTADLELRKDDAFLAVRRSSFSSSEGEDGCEGGETSTRNDLRMLKAKAREDMEFIEELERKAAHDIPAEKATVFREIMELRDSNKDDLSSICSRLSQIQINADSKGQTGDDGSSSTNQPLSFDVPVEMEEHTTDVSDLAIQRPTVPFGGGARSPVIGISPRVAKKMLEGEALAKKSERDGLLTIMQVPSSSSLASIGSPTARLSIEERRKALNAVKDRLAQIRASKDQIHSAFTQVRDNRRDRTATKPLAHRAYMNPTQSSAARKTVIDQLEI